MPLHFLLTDPLRPPPKPPPGACPGPVGPPAAPTTPACDIQPTRDPPGSPGPYVTGTCHCYQALSPMHRCNPLLTTPCRGDHTSVEAELP